MATATDEEVKRVPPEKTRGGVWVRFGLEEYRVPPLAFGVLQELAQHVDVLQSMDPSHPTQEQMGIVFWLVHKALQRNYPDMTLEQVQEMLDLENCTAVLEATLSAAGFRRVAPGEAPPSR